MVALLSSLAPSVWVHCLLPRLKISAPGMGKAFTETRLHRALAGHKHSINRPMQGPNLRARPWLWRRTRAKHIPSVVKNILTARFDTQGRKHRPRTIAFRTFVDPESKRSTRGLNTRSNAKGEPQLQLLLHECPHGHRRRVGCGVVWCEACAANKATGMTSSQQASSGDLRTGRLAFPGR